MTIDEVRQYLADTESIQGWFFPIDAALFAAIDEIQSREGIRGNLFEIGVHHGKSAILLGRMLKPDEILGVCDVFDDQSQNVDHSGAGNLEIFRRNMTVDVRLFAKRSDSLTPDDTTTQCRFIHIDGGHRPVDVINDLRVTKRALLPDGIVAVDDAFNPSWPGVGEGVHRFMAEEPETFVPVIIGGNKAFFARAEGAERYRPWLARIGDFFQSDAYAFEMKEWFGREVVIASRLDWVELHPMDAARLYERGFR